MRPGRKLKIHNVNYKTQDPLYYEYHKDELHGGIPELCRKIIEKRNFLLPLRSMGYILYHMAKSHTYEPVII